ncbi:RnfABCDGE type electron transport complex subunit G [Prevotella brunnea]|uniref:Ion-translocating oxidoreductase complex subunit G n=1 Tax=Prevotella brunnea TaxID=2508867 RepID=A0A5C8GMI7_9BACT|nr:RnfABCDGE type electron transport complex subunit G [Prevotella brunnea]MDR0186001.1 RnfABCDGE type electron transport complex subunit G [Prevotella brunnea]TXJ63058.1 RnfABCDGE type electron transport complex subunit G [Prevotella brunnea]
MKKLESSLTNMVVVLVAAALLMGGVLAYINELTKDTIAAQAEKNLTDGITLVMGGGQLNVTSTDTVKQTIKGKETAFVVHHVANAGKSLGAAVESITQGFGGDLKVLVGFDPEGNILGYTVLTSTETPGLGAKADKWFQKDGKGCVIGKNPSKKPLTVRKDGGEIDAITASTITSRAFLSAINHAYEAYMKK